MSVRKAQAYLAAARNARELADSVSSGQEQQTLLDIADRYERLAVRMSWDIQLKEGQAPAKKREVTFPS